MALYQMSIFYSRMNITPTFIEIDAIKLPTCLRADLLLWWVLKGTMPLNVMYRVHCTYLIKRFLSAYWVSTYYSVVTCKNWIQNWNWILFCNLKYILRCSTILKCCTIFYLIIGWGTIMNCILWIFCISMVFP